MAEAKKLVIGASLPKSDIPDTMVGRHNWCDVPGSSWNVRIGPDYAWNKLKAPSGENLCSVLGVDLLSSDAKITDIGRFFQMPPPTHSAACEAHGLPQPPVFVVNCMIPGYAPNSVIDYWSAVKTDGEGYSLVFFFVLTPEALADWERPEPTMPAIALLRRFVLADMDDEKMHLRFKAITRVQNIPETEVSSATRMMLNSYNSTPFLTRPQHQFFRTPAYFEIDIDVHIFSYMARSGLSGVQSAINSVVFDFSFVVEGYSNDELPECILGCSRLSRLELSSALPFPFPIESAQ